jgi:hypothetical protein
MGSRAGDTVAGKRWAEGGYLRAGPALLAEDMAAIATKHGFKFLFIQSGRTRLFFPPGITEELRKVYR